MFNGHGCMHANDNMMIVDQQCSDGREWMVAPPMCHSYFYIPPSWCIRPIMMMISMSIIVVQCTMCTCVFFPFPKVVSCRNIHHIFVPSRKIEKIEFPCLSNSNFVIFPQMFSYNCSRRICYSSAIRYIQEEYSPDGNIATGEYGCPMYTLCNVQCSQVPQPSTSSQLENLTNCSDM